MELPRRRLFKNLAASSGLILAGSDLLGESPLSGALGTGAESGPDPIYEKPAPVTMAELDSTRFSGVTATEVNDYAACGYKGELKPSPPHADLNPKKAVIITWEKLEHRFVFSHEASYDPWMELPNGVGLCNQFFEGNKGWAELFNDPGRKTRNSFVDIIQHGPQRVWVRWNYFCVNKADDSKPALRGTEDYIGYPNGLMWRRLTYESMMPGQPEGYSWQPIDFFAVAPNGTNWSDLFPRDAGHGDYHVATALDVYSDRRYDVFWDDNGKPRRNGTAELLLGISHSQGFAMVMPFKAGHLFTILGPAAGWPSTKSQIVDNSFDDTGGWGWSAARWDHWPVGWLNEQSNDYKPGSSKYPYHFGPLSHYSVNHPLKNGKTDYAREADDMELNRWSERRVFYTLTGVASDMQSIRRLAKRWLDQGKACAMPESIANLHGG